MTACKDDRCSSWRGMFHIAACTNPNKLAGTTYQDYVESLKIYNTERSVISNVRRES